MNISRGALLARLNEAKVGLSAKETVQQSSCFVFSAEHLTTFNDSIMVRVPNPLKELCGTPDNPVDLVVPATDLLTIVSKFPDDEVVVTAKDGELRLKGTKGNVRKAGISYMSEVQLPTETVPAPERFARLGEGLAGLLQQAARTCGDNEAKFLTTVVHVTPDRVEACDNMRLFRVDLQTGFQKEVLLPADSVSNLEGLELTKVSVGDSWVHFKTANGGLVSLRCSHEEYHKHIDQILQMENPNKVTLPANLGEIVSRAEVFNTGGYDSRIGVRIAANELTITSRKEGGWYKEKRGVEYSGPPLAFEVNPKFLVEVLGRTRDVAVDARRMKIVNDRIQFVAVVYQQKDEDDASPPRKERTRKADPENPIGEESQFTEDDIPF
jgi:DNA polymerase III sliding clamp (beta) subunit (PCNA family)